MTSDKSELLRERARVLAREPEREENPDEFLPVVEFLLADEHYAVELVHISEVCPLKDITPLPCTPPFVAGMVNVRGRILTLLDIKEFFDLPRRGLTDRNNVIILRGGGLELGLLVDGVIGMRSLPLREIQPSLPTLTGIRAEYLRGVTPQPLVILDAAAVLADPKIVVDEEVGP